MTFELMRSVFANLGLSKVETQIYAFLAESMPQGALDISKALSLEKRQLYAGIKNLEEKKIIKCTNDRPKRFSATPIEKIIDELIKKNVEEAKQIEENKEKILSLWHSMVNTNSSKS